MSIKIFAKLAEIYSKDPGRMLLHTGTIGWILSCAAQTIAIATNDKIDKKQKAYLIPQEIFDGLVNIVSFYVLTKSFKDIFLKLVSTGKLANKSIMKFLQKNNLTNKIGKMDFNIEKLANYSEIEPEYRAFKDGVGVVSSTIGSIISCNIVTPILRNKLANAPSRVLREEMDKMDKEKQNPVQSYNSYRSPMASYMNHAGGMKI
ncbi:hypothetical protein J6S88_02535 [bacterium]|nr:hypothetical protein [bacterium]